MPSEDVGAAGFAMVSRCAPRARAERCLRRRPGPGSCLRETDGNESAEPVARLVDEEEDEGALLQERVRQRQEH
jgi:hypothetical protein